MTGHEIAEWLGISYSGTYRKNPSKYVAQLGEYCEYTQVRGGVIISEIYIEEYNKNLVHDRDMQYLKTISEANEHLVSMTGIEAAGIMSVKQATKARNALFGKSASNDGYPDCGILGYRELVWAVKLPGENAYRALTAEEDELFDSLITTVYSNLEPEKLKAQNLLLDYCSENGFSAKQYKQLLTTHDLDFFYAVISKFKKLTGLMLVHATRHTLANNLMLNHQENAYKNKLLSTFDIEEQKIMASVVLEQEQQSNIITYVNSAITNADSAEEVGLGIDELFAEDPEALWCCISWEED